MEPIRKYQDFQAQYIRKTNFKKPHFGLRPTCYTPFSLKYILAFRGRFIFWILTFTHVVQDKELDTPSLKVALRLVLTLIQPFKILYF